VALEKKNPEGEFFPLGPLSYFVAKSGLSSKEPLENIFFM
jgi:hypothetical protein